MGLMKLLSVLGQTANPAEDWLKSQYPDLFKNGARLPSQPAGWTPPFVLSQTTDTEPQLPVGGAQDGPVAEQPAPASPSPKKGGVLNALKSVFMPDAGSFMYSALNNPNGLWGASGAQDAYKQNQQATALANAKAAAELAKAQRNNEFQVVGNNIVTYDQNGQPTFMTPPATPSEQERLIDKWKNTAPGPERDLIERAIRGYQYTPPVIQAQADARTRTGVAVAQARGAEARKTKQTKGASSGGKAGGAKLPPGFILNP